MDFEKTFAKSENIKKTDKDLEEVAKLMKESDDLKKNILN